MCRGFSVLEILSALQLSYLGGNEILTTGLMDAHITDLFNSNLILEIYLLYDFNFSDMKTFYLFRLSSFLQNRSIPWKGGEAARYSNKQYHKTNFHIGRKTTPNNCNLKHCQIPGSLWCRIINENFHHKPVYRLLSGDMSSSYAQECKRLKEKKKFRSRKEKNTSSIPDKAELPNLRSCELKQTHGSIQYNFL